jgi:hypothetical protein
MANSKFRVGGGYTVFSYHGLPLAYVDVVRETAPRPVAAPQAIQPLDAPYPIEIALPAALEAGTIEITFREQWNSEVWEQLGGANGPFVHTQDLLEVFKVQLQQDEVALTKVIGTPGQTPIRTITYKNVTVVNVMIDETVNIGTMTFPKSVQFMYTQRLELWSS